mmetsp:Transcript_8952/g.36948  ORF Transcript_8952/g.36948 Transcript_8952/m.36948 type:complete len:329 (-) Transcript_8952:46-1032(-)
MPKPAVMEQRKLLDALMGADRNSDLVEDSKTTKHYTDPDVCKNYICGLCPHVLFNNTKMDMGDCPLKHSEVLRVDYEMSKGDKEAVKYERYLFHTLVQMVGDCDRKIARAQARLQAEAPDDGNSANLTSAIQALCAKAEELGEQGKINESMEVFAQAEELKRKQAAGGGQEQSTSTQQQLRVCDVCGAFLSIFDSNRRLADHFGGKLHIGYLQMRERLEALKKELPIEEQETPPPPLPTVMDSQRPGGDPRGDPRGDPHQSLRRISRAHDDRDDGRQRRYRDRDSDRERRSSGYDRDRRDSRSYGGDRSRGGDRYGSSRREREREYNY